MVQKQTVTRKQALWVLGIMLVIFIGIPVACGISMANMSSSPTTSSQMPGSGDNAVFTSGGSDFITFTQDKFKQLSNFAQAGNTNAIQDMLNTGEAMTVTPGTQVEVISTNWDGSANIKIMSGPYSGSEAYTFMNALEKQ